MFKIFSVDQNNIETEIIPLNGIYIVYELFEYKILYEGLINERLIFIEDEVFDSSLLKISSNSIESLIKKRIFEDYFGYLTINVNSEIYNFEVRIKKLKVPELESILLYLWNQDPIIFDNFFSKSTLKSKLSNVSENLNFSSKFVNVFNDFYTFFKVNFHTFKLLPYSVLRNKTLIKEYDSSNISLESIDWLIENLDELDIDYMYKNDNDSIKINNSYASINKILTVEKTNNYNVYENQIILGSFQYVISEIKRLKNVLSVHTSIIKNYDKEYYSIDEFRIIPFIKLKDDFEKIESKIKQLFIKYKEIFKNSLTVNANPKLTPVFSKKRHYSEAYKKILLIRDIKINLNGEINLLNIKKISTLYERYNLYVLLNNIFSNNPISFHKQNLSIKQNIFQEYYFKFHQFEISLFYDFYIGNSKNNSGLQRISKGYYKPDYVIHVLSKNFEKFYILDSKYSSENTVKDKHASKCINNYILDIGLSNFPTTKIQELILLYPGENQVVLYGDNTFSPKISIMPSKIKKEYIGYFINEIIETVSKSI